MRRMDIVPASAFSCSVSLSDYTWFSSLLAMVLGRQDGAAEGERISTLNV